MDKETQELIKKCLKSDSKSTKMLYDTHKSMMFGVCLRYASNRDEAKDLLQEGFIKVFAELHNYKPIAPLGAWMRKIQVNICLMHLRTKKMQFTDLEHLPQTYVAEQDIFSELGEQELIRMIQNLPEGYRAIFNLYVIEGYSHVEIAELLGISEGTSKSQLSRARAILQKMIVKNVNS